ncbi:DUF945 family protein [Thalassotalea sp. PLHSN55]|uniref:DUF945 family protein n=1 Tax=Thalassotalea sp. PLHSN55 TaxID=3435888 RepID=UPI003F833110
MNKAAFAIGALLCVGLAGPKIVGHLVEQEYDYIANSVAQNPSIAITQRRFTSNWFSGESSITFTLKGMEAEFENFEITVNETLSFGPVIFNSDGLTFALAHSDSTLNFNLVTADADAQAELEKLTASLNEKLTISSLIDYQMNYNTDMKLAQMSFEQDGNSVKIGEFNSHFILSDEKYIVGDFYWAGLDFNGPNALVTVSPLEMTFEQEIISGNIYSGNALSSGDFSMMIDSITSQDKAGNSLVNIEKLGISGNSDIEQELMNMNLVYQVKKLTSYGQQLDNLNIDMSLNKLDTKVLQELNELMAQMGGEPSAEDTQAIMAVASKLLLNDPEININDLSVTTVDGEIKSDLSMTIDHTMYDAQNPMSIMAALKANAQGNAPLAYFQNLGLAGMIDMYVEQGLLVKDADKLSFDAQFEQGQLKVNGQVLPL